MRGQDIAPYVYSWAGEWVITLEFGAHKYLEVQYPAIYAHLIQYEERLKARGQCTNKPATEKKSYTGQHHWLELDNNPTRKYLELFEKEKLLWAETAKEPKFVLDREKYYTNKTCFMIMGDNLAYLNGVLNSKLTLWLLKRNCALLGDGFSMGKIFVEQLPIPKIDSANQSIADKIIALVEEILEKKKQDSATDTTEPESQINALVYTLYNLTDEEIKLIEKG